MKKNPKPAKEKAKDPVLKEQDRIDAHIKEELQESTSEQGFPQSQETLVAAETVNTEDSVSGWIYKPSDEEVLKQGTLVDGKYEIIALLGHGGMGSVYMARHKELGTQVALKVLHRFLVNTRSALERFKTEARAAHTLSSKNLVSVLDYGILSDGQPYLTMHCIDGINLADYIKTKGTLSIGDTFSVVRQVAAALEEAHNKGIVHRDIKPSNILIEGNVIKEGSVKVVDFGISKALANDASEQQVTHTGQIFGSPFYMSPEQCKGESVDFRTDLYSLGCVMFECLTGSRLFEGKNAIETLMMHCNETPPTLGVEGKPPSGFAEAKTILKKLLAKDPQHRFDSATSLSKALNIDTGFSPNKIFAIGRSVAGDMRFQKKMMHICVLLAILISVYALLQMNQKPAELDAQTRLEELYRLGGAHDKIRVREEQQKDQQYLEEAVELAEKTFGKISPQTAEAYNLLGHRAIGDVHIGGKLLPQIETLKRAISISDDLALNNPKVLPPVELKLRRQRYTFDLAEFVEENDWKLADSLYARALAFGPVPQNSSFWNSYSYHLQRHGDFLKAARVFAEMRTEGKETLPTLKELSHQQVGSVLGNFITPPTSVSPSSRIVQSNEMRLSLKGNTVNGELYLHALDANGTEIAYPLVNKFTGTFKEGYLRCYSSSGPDFIVARIGKYLSVIDYRISRMQVGNSAWSEKLLQKK